MDCLICSEDVIRTGYAVSVKCGHIFHGKCLLQWMATKNSCPVCRIDVVHDEITPLYLANEMGRDENYKYIWNDTRHLNVRSISAQVDTIIVVSPVGETEPSKFSVFIGVGLSLVFAITFVVIFFN